mmetsp:Transcript_53914/g.109940  ORF Transcript_53914/g.109940 Transcript_53914/m.109940 type:complete len:582 (+) Transcript_53914:125-1870(+)|eukprot:CAMPEP_0181330444 /NCGR_PEP_ID=MMETSP1101-20121128/23903_1 /TAXON_ID=46948 /ORGANISM="Rhodomonas abbreviata, Strain Caron Lab Isolate" /LENGTH=581 /DNA_ID=CAMNT_0023439701 /DNA_START=123 /DNA_END=1868 /DNA_ORIENTATION=+
MLFTHGRVLVRVVGLRSLSTGAAPTAFRTLHQAPGSFRNLQLKPFVGRRFMNTNADNKEGGSSKEDGGSKEEGPKKSWWTSAEFWGGLGALAGWGMTGAAIKDAMTAGPEIISPNMTGVMLVYSSLFARWAWIVQPRNTLLAACHVSNVIAQCNQMRRLVEWEMESGMDAEVKDQAMKGAAVASGIAVALIAGPMAQKALIATNVGFLAAFAAADAGIFTVHFWAPMSKWLISGASFVDLERPTEKISIAQYTALTATGLFFSRYALLVKPINYLLCSVNIALFTSSAWHLGRKINADYLAGPEISVEGKTVLITGGAMGMGKIYAEKAVAEKAGVVILWDVNAEKLKETAAELTAKGGKVVTQVVDISQLAAIQKAGAQVKKDYGKVDLLFNNAGIVRGKLFWEHDPVRDVQLTMNINSLAPMWITQEFLPGMMESKEECRIVNVCSAAGLLSNPKMSVYCASKSAAVGWSDSLRLELLFTGNEHIKVTTVCPSYISTGMFDGVKPPLLTPILTPEYVTGKVWSGMKQGKPILKMPWTVQLSLIGKGCLPLPLWDFVAGKIFGVYSTMDNFKGHTPPAAK